MYEIVQHMYVYVYMYLLLSFLFYIWMYVCLTTLCDINKNNIFTKTKGIIFLIHRANLFAVLYRSTVMKLRRLNEWL